MSPAAHPAPVLALVLASAAAAQTVGSGNDLLPDPPPSIARVALELVTIAPDAVIDITSARDGSGRLFLVSPSGTIRISLQDGVPPLATPFLSDPAWPPTSGMSALEFHPAYASNGRLFVITGEALPNGHAPHYGSPQDETAGAMDSVLYEYAVSAGDANQADLASKRELLRIRRPTGVHPMNDLAFGGDGFLYVAIGDGGLTGDGTPTRYLENGQDTTSAFGCVLRIDVDAIGPNGRYAIPPDNPFADGANGNVPEMFAWGLRNPWRLGTDRATGRVWAADNGDATIEEVILLERGANYGWGLKEGSFLYDPDTHEASVDPSPDPALSDPFAEYDHAHTTVAFGSIIGGTVYRGARMPWLRGQYVAFDHVAGELLSVDTTSGAIRLLPQAPGSIHLGHSEDITLGDDESGELYVGRLNGLVLRVVPAPHHVAQAPGRAPAGLAPLAGAEPYGCGWNEPASLRLVAAQRGERTRLCFAVPPLAAGERAWLLLASAPDPAFPCGTLVLDAERALVRERLVDLSALAAAPVAATPAGAHEREHWIDVTLPPEPSLAGARLFAQAWFLGPGESAARPALRASVGLALTLAP